MNTRKHSDFRDDRMVWAFDTVNGGIVRIGLGQAEHLRERARAGQLVCPVGDCASPNLTTRASYTTWRGTLVPDGFRHVSSPNPGHGLETTHHITGKLVVKRWLERLGFDEVTLERRDTQSGRTPDVTATRNGSRFAVEVQFSPISTAEWSQRTKELADSGFSVLWLWGSNMKSDSAKMQPAFSAQGEMRRRGIQITLIDPDEDSFGIMTAPFIWHDSNDTINRMSIPVEPGNRQTDILWFSSEAFSIIDRQIFHPILQELIDNSLHARQIILTQLESCIRKLHRRRKPTAPRYRATSSNSSPPPVTPERPFNTAISVPKASSGRTSLLKPTEFGWAVLKKSGLIPIVGATYKGDRYIYWRQDEWHAGLVLRILYQPSGTHISSRTITSFIEEHTRCEEDKGRFAVRGLLDAMERQRWIQHSGSGIRVIRSLGDTVEVSRCVGPPYALAANSSSSDIRQGSLFFGE